MVSAVGAGAQSPANVGDKGCKDGTRDSSSWCPSLDTVSHVRKVEMVTSLPGEDTTLIASDPHQNAQQLKAAPDHVAPSIGGKNEMKATWHQNDPSTWNLWQRGLYRMGALQFLDTTEAPRFATEDPVPYFPIWKQHLWIFPRAVAPLVVHYFILKVFGSFHPLFAFTHYAVSLAIIGLLTINHAAKLTKVYGFLDGGKARDGIPDIYARKVLWGLAGVVSVRPLFAVFLVYDRHEPPALSIFLPLQMFLYAVVLDFWFYW
ncbi:unnamed protein product [Sympodiomycopsis kandeliae]